ncbi:MAG: diguanylate cyclase, partial [Bacillota bacterium]|nr:diguanylate cyclase [Bacillota bacterium]
MRDKNGRLTFVLLVDWFAGWGDLGCYQWGIYSGVADYAKEKDINLLTFVTGRLESPREWENKRNILLQFINDDIIDGIITTPSCINVFGSDSGKSPILEKYSNIPTVVIGEDYEGQSSVCVNNYDGMKSVIEHLIKVHHCRKIAFLKGIKGSKETEFRFQAYLDALKENDIQYDPELVYLGDTSFLAGCEGILHFINKGIVFDGLACTNDDMAVGALIEYFRTMGKPMEGIHIVGFDDAENSRVHNLTTVRQSLFDEGRAAGEVLVRLIKGEKGPIKRELDAEVIIRASCGCQPENKVNTTGVEASESVYEKYIKTSGRASHMNEYQSLDLEIVEEELVTNIDLNAQMDILYSYLPKFGFHGAFLSIYEDPEEPLKLSRLILAYTKEGRFDVGNAESTYPTEDILPRHIWDVLQKDRFNIIVQALHHDSQLGYLILSLDFKPSQVLERIRLRTSSTIKAALMLKRLQEQTFELERQVAQRTKELSDTNEQLMDEVEKRKNFEEQLKRALEDLESYNRILHLQSLCDELTGLYNRRGFITLANERIARLKGPNSGCLIFYADLDGLKQINDTYGHAEGDFTLSKAAELLTQAFKSTDIIGRIGGDEFTVLVIGAAERDKNYI